MYGSLGNGNTPQVRAQPAVSSTLTTLWDSVKSCVRGTLDFLLGTIRNTSIILSIQAQLGILVKASLDLIAEVYIELPEAFIQSDLSTIVNLVGMLIGGAAIVKNKFDPEYRGWEDIVEAVLSGSFVLMLGNNLAKAFPDDDANKVIFWLTSIAAILYTVYNCVELPTQYSREGYYTKFRDYPPGTFRLSRAERSSSETSAIKNSAMILGGINLASALNALIWSLKREKYGRTVENSQAEIAGLCAITLAVYFPAARNMFSHPKIFHRFFTLLNAGLKRAALTGAGLLGTINSICQLFGIKNISPTDSTIIRTVIAAFSLASGGIAASSTYVPTGIHLKNTKDFLKFLSKIKNKIFCCCKEEESQQAIEDIDLGQMGSRYDPCSHLQTTHP